MTRNRSLGRYPRDPTRVSSWFADLYRLWCWLLRLVMSLISIICSDTRSDTRLCSLIAQSFGHKQRNTKDNLSSTLDLHSQDASVKPLPGCAFIGTYCVTLAFWLGTWLAIIQGSKLFNTLSTHYHLLAPFLGVHRLLVSVLHPFCVLPNLIFISRFWRWND